MATPLVGARKWEGKLKEGSREKREEERMWEWGDWNFRFIKDFSQPIFDVFFSFILIQKVSISSSFPPFFRSAFCSIFLNQDGCRLMGTLYYSTFITEGQSHSFSFENQIPHIYAAQIIVCHFPWSDGKMDRRLSWGYLHKKPLCYRGTRMICFACAFIASSSSSLVLSLSTHCFILGLFSPHFINKYRLDSDQWAPTI